MIMRPSTFFGLTLALLGALALPAITAHAAVSTDSLVGYWKFDEGTGTLAADSSGHGNNGTLTLGPTWSADPTNVITFTNPYALSFDGVDDYVQTTLAPSGYTGISMAAWVKLDAAGSYPMVMSYGTNADNVLEIRGNSGLGRMEIIRRSDNTAVTDPTSSVGTGWHHFVGQGNGTTFSLYKDGVLVGSSTASHNINSATTFRFGRRSDDGGSSYCFTGSIDDVRIYSRALSAAEIAAL
ncbi:MAG: LamG domain-containing protein, partial [Patescibacteria group bacterium]